MLYIEWSPITESECIAPFGDGLRAHLEGRKGAARRASCSAWQLLYEVLQKHGLPIAEVTFTESGKPGFADPGLMFSISHSGGLCAVAVADRPVGVDVELCRERYHPRLIERSLTASEREVFDGDFTRLWCRKEAAAKMTGEGITGYPGNIETSGYVYSEELIENEGRKYWLAACHGVRMTDGGRVGEAPPRNTEA